MTSPRQFAIIPAGGIGSRMGLNKPKQLLQYKGRSVLAHTIGLFRSRVSKIVVPIPPEHRQQFSELEAEDVLLVDGGATRFESVQNGFRALGEIQPEDLILVHDGVRPFLDPGTLPTAFQLAREKGAVIYAHAAVDTMKQVDAEGRIQRTLDRRQIYHAQTPQIFKAELLQKAYATDLDQAEVPTDEARLLECCHIPVFIYQSSAANRKLTHREDLSLLNNANLRIGHGYDVHRVDPQCPLFLGGIEIPDAPGLAGHSDADVAIHALIDAMLGASGKGDIGQWFPDDDPRYAGIRSTILLEKVTTALASEGYQLVNADITIAAQAPKLAPHIPNMRACLAEILKVDIQNLNIKATTTEKLGFVGRKEGIAVDAVVLLLQPTRES